MKFGATFSSMYEVYNAGLSLEEMAERLVQENREKKKVKALQRVYMLENYENVKEDLYIRIVSQREKRTGTDTWNLQKNRRYYTGCIFPDWGRKWKSVQYDGGQDFSG